MKQIIISNIDMMTAIEEMQLKDFLNYKKIQFEEKVV